MQRYADIPPHLTYVATIPYGVSGSIPTKHFPYNVSRGRGHKLAKYSLQIYYMTVDPNFDSI